MTYQRNDTPEPMADSDLTGLTPPAVGVISPTGWFTCDGKPLTEEDLAQIDRDLSGATVNEDGTITSLPNEKLN